MTPRVTIVDSAKQIVKTALEEAAKRAHRDLDADEVANEAYDEIAPVRHATGSTLSPYFSDSPIIDNQAAIHKHLGILVNVIHQDVEDIKRIVALCYVIEMGHQLKAVGHSRAAAVITTFA